MAKIILDIPDNATCGEVIEALFPDFEFREKHGIYSNYFNEIRVKQELWDEPIEDMPTVTPQEPRWIPVSERLPKAGEYVGNVAKYYLVQNEYGDMLVARYTHSGYWEQIYQLKSYTDEIVAWMPLPEPYKGENDG